MTGAPQMFVLEDVEAETDAPLQLLVARTRDALQRGLERTSGSTLRRLRGPWDGRAFRVRWEDYRAIASRLPAADGAERVYIHWVGHRREVYAAHAFLKDRR